MAASSSTSGSGPGSALTERRGIPGAQFVEDVQTYLTQSGLDVGSALAFLQERLQQYKVVEMKLLAQQRDLQAKIPDIEKCLDIVATLQAKKGTGELRRSFCFPLKVDGSVDSTSQATGVCMLLRSSLISYYKIDTMIILFPDIEKQS
ncbi:unnamed protein product [Sphenostylis stenocarpa]|uniref:Prefoldin subunit 3 n=1 Tax=Sphenostylis stenocarpa TaxID=92480 RepID=A0AA86TE71_9FABA|nr:unnamed protein product [Sphenostylis stenocarpa]